jgi:hypothetical protein
MKKNRCIVQIISITRQAQVKHFQVRIPSDAKYLVGIETAVRMKGIQNFGVNPIIAPIANGGFPNFSPAFSPDPFGNFGSDAAVFRSPLAGELKLQSCEEANIFYATNITDPTAQENLDKIPTPGQIIENVWTHGYKRELEKILVDGNTTVLAGLYKDRMGEMQNRDVSYDVFLYVWYKLENKKHDHQPCT